MAHFQAIVNQKNSFQVETGQASILMNKEELPWDVAPLNETTYHLIYKGRSYTIELVSIDQGEKQLVLKINGKLATLGIKSSTDLLLDKMGLTNLAGSAIKEVKAPMPGLILSLLVEEGQSVTKGQPLAILEAMKMENVLKAPTDGIVSSIKVRTAQSVEKNQVLFQF
jgi:biotin carboxyl carrier protein